MNNKSSRLKGWSIRWGNAAGFPVVLSVDGYYVYSGIFSKISKYIKGGAYFTT